MKISSKLYGWFYGHYHKESNNTIIKDTNRRVHKYLTKNYDNTIKRTKTETRTLMFKSWNKLI